MSQRPLNIGITCYASLGGSGIMATEIGLEMARRGHRVHFVSASVPRRYDRRVDGVFFHGVEMQDYPLLAPPPYTVALASKLVDVSRWEQLDIVHVHYAVPHAVSAYLARQVLGADAPRFVTTLHGTDTTLVGADPTYQPVTRFCIEQSDGVSVPSAFLREAARNQLGVTNGPGIEVLPNFVDTEVFQPPNGPNGHCLGQLFGSSEPATTLIHVSNFRAVKRVGDVVEIFARVASELPARLIMVGDGPERSRAEARLRALGLADRVRFLGMQEHFADLLGRACVFLMPSGNESFGLAALEAQSCGVPVVGSRVGGLPEVIADGETGYLAEVGDVDTMVARVLELARDEARRKLMSEQARTRVMTHFRRAPVMDRYEAWYHNVLGRDRR